MVIVAKVLARTLLLKKTSCLKHATFRIFGDNLQIPSSWITTIFYPSWHEARGVKSWLATRGHREGNLLGSSAAFHPLPTSCQAFKWIVLGTDVTDYNMKHIQSWICHCTHTHTQTLLLFLNNGVITQIFLRLLHVWMCLSNWKRLLFPK